MSVGSLGGNEGIEESKEKGERDVKDNEDIGEDVGEGETNENYTYSCEGDPEGGILVTGKVQGNKENYQSRQSHQYL